MPTKGVPLGAANKLPKLRGSGEGSVKGAPDNWPKPRKPHGQTRALKNFLPGEVLSAAARSHGQGCGCALCADAARFERERGLREGYDEHGYPRRGYSPTGDVPTFKAPTERPSFGEQFVELLGEFVDAREQYAHARRDVGSEYANSDDMDKAGDALQALLDKRFP